MNKYIYPRPMDLDVFVRWHNFGDSMFLGADRKQTVQSMKELVKRMALPPEYEEMRREVLGASCESTRGHRFGHGPSEEFRQGVTAALRLCGYVYYPSFGAPLMDRVPLEPQQIHLLRLITRGYSTRELAEALGTDPSNIRWRTNTLRRGLGCTSTGQAIATAYQRLWLPTLAEERDLIKQGAPTVPGLVVKDTVTG